MQTNAALNDSVSSAIKPVWNAIFRLLQQSDDSDALRVIQHAASNVTAADATIYRLVAAYALVVVVQRPPPGAISEEAQASLARARQLSSIKKGSAREDASDFAVDVLLASLLCWYTDHLDLARSLLQEVLQILANSSAPATLEHAKAVKRTVLRYMGFVDLSSPNAADQARALGYFTEALTLSGTAIDVEAQYGRMLALYVAAAALQGKSSFDKSLQRANDAAAESVLQFSTVDATPFRLARSHFHWLLQQWPVVLEDSKEVSRDQPEQLVAWFNLLCLSALQHLEDAELVGPRLFDVVARHEKRNPELLCLIAKALASFPEETVQQRLLSLASNYFERCIRSDAGDWSAMGELRLCQHDQKGAVDAFEKAIAIRAQHLGALIGLARCALLTYQPNKSGRPPVILDTLFKLDAKEVATEEEAHILLLLQSDIALRIHQDETSQWRLLHGCITAWDHVLLSERTKGVMSQPIAFPMYLRDLERTLNALFLYFGVLTFRSPAIVPAQIRQMQPLVDRYVAWVANSTKAYLFEARMHLLCARYAEATAILEECVAQFPDCAEAFLLSAQAALCDDHTVVTDGSKVQRAAEYLDLAMSASFRVREHPEYHLWRARCATLSDEPARTDAKAASAVVPLVSSPFTKAALLFEDAMAALHDAQQAHARRDLLAALNNQQAAAWVRYKLARLDMQHAAPDAAVTLLRQIAPEHLYKTRPSSFQQEI